MSSNCNLVARATALAVLFTSGQALADSHYVTEAHGTLIDKNGNQSTLSMVPGLASTPSNSSAGGQDWSIGTNADNVSGGHVSAQVIMSNPSQNTTDGGYAKQLYGDTSEFYTINLAPQFGAVAIDNSVPVDVLAIAGLEWNQDGVATAEFRFTDVTTGTILIDDQLSKTSNPGLNFIHGSLPDTIDRTLNLNPNDTFQVFMTAHAFGDINGFSGSGDDGGMEITASVDPTFTILGDYASRWTVVGVPVDDTTGGAGAVPEPAVWEMLLTGFGLAGASLRHRHALARQHIRDWLSPQPKAE